MVCKGLGFAHTQVVDKCQLGSGQGDFQDIQQLSLSSKTLPKALRTQELTALTSNFGLEGLIQYAW